MAITKQVLGSTKKGETVTLYTMKNRKGAEASVTDLGATWTRMLVPDKEGNLADVLLGYDTVESIYENAGSMGAIVGRRTGSPTSWQKTTEKTTSTVDRTSTAAGCIRRNASPWRTRTW